MNQIQRLWGAGSCAIPKANKRVGVGVATENKGFVFIIITVSL